MILPLDSRGRLKWDSSTSGGRKSLMPSSSVTDGVLVEEDPVKTTPLVARSLRPESRPRNAKKVLFAAAPVKAEEELRLAEMPVTGKVENNQEEAEDSLALLPGFSQVGDNVANKITFDDRCCRFQCFSCRTSMSPRKRSPKPAQHVSLLLLPAEEKEGVDFHYHGPHLVHSQFNLGNHAGYLLNSPNLVLLLLVQLAHMQLDSALQAARKSKCQMRRCQEQEVYYPKLRRQIPRMSPAEFPLRSHRPPLVLPLA